MLMLTIFRKSKMRHEAEINRLHVENNSDEFYNKTLDLIAPGKRELIDFSNTDIYDFSEFKVVNVFKPARKRGRKSA